MIVTSKFFRPRRREDVLWRQVLTTVIRPSVQARKLSRCLGEERHLMRQRFIYFIAQFDGFVSASSFSVLVKRAFVLLANEARFIAKRFKSLIDWGKLRVDFGGDADVVDVVEELVIRDCCFANSQSVCIIFRKRRKSWVYGQYFWTFLQKRRPTCWRVPYSNSCACACGFALISTSTRSVLRCFVSLASRSVFRLLRESFTFFSKELKFWSVRVDFGRVDLFRARENCSFYKTRRY